MVKLIADLKEAIKKEGLVVPGINNRFLLSSKLITFNREKKYPFVNRKSTL